MAPADFERFCNPNEQLLKVLQRYLLAIQLLIRPVLVEEQRAQRGSTETGTGDRERATAVQCANRWADKLGDFPRQWRCLLTWCESIHERASSGELYKNIFEDGSDFLEL